MEMRDVGAAQNEAARSLAGMSWDAMRSNGNEARPMAIEVRDVWPTWTIGLLSPGPPAVKK